MMVFSMTYTMPLSEKTIVQPLMETRHVSRYFTRSSGFLSRKKSFAAVHDVSLTVPKGQTLGIIGESGCGKSTLGKMLAGLLPPSTGDVLLHGQAIYTKNTSSLGSLPPAIGKTVQMIFQDPNASLNPRMRIGESVGEPLRCLYPEITKKNREEQVQAILAEVGIDPDYATRYPHAFSGGQRQRIAIARALVANPSIIICDEPTSSLDSSVQAQVLNLLDMSQQRHGVSYVFISHDLAVVRHMSDHVAVMYQGSVMEQGSTQDVFSHPCHPYTHLLLDSVPNLTTFANKQTPYTASPLPNNAETTLAGCPFAARCPKVSPQCLRHFPSLEPAYSTKATTSPSSVPHTVRCFHQE